MKTEQNKTKHHERLTFGQLEVNSNIMTGAEERIQAGSARVLSLRKHLLQ